MAEKKSILRAATTLPVVVGVIGALATISIWATVQSQTDRDLLRLNFSEAKTIEQEIALTFAERVRSLERMAQRLSKTPPPSREQWQADAANYLAHYKDIKVISITDSTSLIRDLAPLESYGQFKNSLYFSRDPKRKSALERVKRHKIPTITGLVERKSGGKGIVIVSPIFNGAKVEKYLLATLDPEDFFSKALTNQKFEIEVREDQELIFSNIGEETRKRNSAVAVEASSTIYDVKFVVKAIPKLGSPQSGESRLATLVLIFGLTISLLLALTMGFARAAKTREEDVVFLVNKMDSILSLAPVGIFETDANGQCTYVNSTWTLYTGLNQNEAMNDGWRRAIHPKDRSMVETEWLRSTKSEIPFQLRFRYLNVKDATVRWVDCQSVVVKNAQGTTTGYLGASLNVSEQKTAEDRLSESQKFLTVVLDTLPVALFCKDNSADFKFTLWNKAAEEIWGLSQTEVLGKNDFDLFPRLEAEQFRAKDLAVLTAGGVVEIPEEQVTTDGAGTVTVRTKKTVIPGIDGQPRFLLGVSEDISQKIRIERLLEEQRVRIIQTERMTLLGEMAGGVAHEINNPLTIIEGYSYQLGRAAEDPAMDRTYVAKVSEKISATTDRIAKIIKGLRAFARDGQNDPFENTKISTLLEECLDFCQSKFQRKGVLLEVNQADKSIEIECRRVQITQVILNLLNNSLDAVAGLQDASIKIEVKEDGDKIRVAISNSGPLIPEKDRDKIMKPFFTTKAPGSGTGLGLSISSNLVASHGGKLFLNLESARTEFVVELPKQRPREV